MDKTSLVINRAGVYLFHSPTKVSLQLNKELLVLLSVPNRRLAGFLVVDFNTHASDSFVLLDALVRKMNREFQVSTPDIHAKLLGMATGALSIKAKIQKWLSDHAIEIVAEDTGRNVCRTVFVDCESGLAGVSYAENYAPQWSEESADKTKASSKTHSALVISSSKKSIGLTKKLVSKMNDWTVEATTDLKTFFSKESDLSHYEAIFLFDDLTKKFEKQVKHFLAVAHQNRSNIKVYWCGKRPKFASKCFALPAAAGTQLTKFKAAFTVELDTIAGHLTGTVIRFPGPTKRRAS